MSEQERAGGPADMIHFTGFEGRYKDVGTTALRFEQDAPGVYVSARDAARFARALGMRARVANDSTVSLTIDSMAAEPTLAELEAILDCSALPYLIQERRPDAPQGKRAVAREHRLTTQSLLGYKIRYWFEADPDHGGVERRAAELQVDAGEGHVRYVYRLRSGPSPLSAMEIATILLEAAPACNSVEVDNGMYGACAHRDWP